MKNIFLSLRFNGCNHLLEGRSIRQVVYANMIWMASYLTFIIHSSVIVFFISVPLLPYILITLLFHLLYISVYFFVKYKLPQIGKHVLIITTYVAVAVFDHLSNKETFTFLYLFAFLPSALNIFNIANKRILVSLYLSFPLFYTLFTKLAIYTYPHFTSFTDSSVIIITTVNIILAFTLSLTFATYMILNNIAKQKKLLVQSISLQATLNNSAAAIWSIDDDYNLTAVNTMYTESIEKEFGIYGLKAGINIKRHLLWEKLPALFKEQYASVLNGKDFVHETELNGRYYEIKGVSIYDTKGKIQGATFGSRDITEIKKTEETLINAKKAAENASSAKARFLSNMSHELRTPLNGIIGFTRIMQDQPYLPEQAQNFKTLQDLSEHTLQIINNILDFAKIEAGKSSLESKRFNLFRFINKITSIFAGTAQLKGIKLDVETEGDTDIYIKGDEVRLSQVLINLLGNAFKFTEKGNVTFKVSTAENEEHNSYMVRFAVSDTGIGIKKENIKKIFESFNQADSHTTRRFGGTGLGLSIADKILNLMNTQLTVESEYGRGTTFWFEIALQKSSYILPPSIAETFHSKDAQLKIDVLLAEDNKVNQIVASRMLQKWEAHVTTASNGQEAVDFARANNYDIILMDLDMPVMDGYEAVKIIRDISPETPVIALTAASFDDMTNFLLLKGFTEVVQKPFVPDELYSKIISVIKPLKIPEQNISEKEKA